MRRRHQLSLSSQDSLPVGTTFDFDYTGTVQSIDLPKGRYKLQCWGAQGGNVTGSYVATGSKGGYSEGILKLDSEKTLYVFVGGQGTNYTSSASQTSTTTINGGWNGGGAGVRTSRYNNSNNDGRSFPRPGGGATDIALVSSDMSYSSNVTNRSSASLLSRFIVAGGGAGASSAYQTITKVGDSTITFRIDGYTSDHGFANGPALVADNVCISDFIADSNEWDWVPGIGETITLQITSKNNYKVLTRVWEGEGNTKIHEGYAKTFSVGDYAWKFKFNIYGDGSTIGEYVWIDVTVTRSWESTTTNNYTYKSSGNAQGGGTSGIGQNPGSQSSAGSGGSFGFGANQTTTNYRFCSGAGGGGWYGGGRMGSDNTSSYINYTGGGSGFVNTASASHRPSNYTGLELESGQTIAGNTSFPSHSGGSETGHSGNGFARITVI